MKLDRKKWIERLTLILLLLLVIFTAGKVSGFLKDILIGIKKVTTPFFIGLIIAYLLNPIVNALNKRHFPRSVAILLIYSLFFLFIAFIVINFGPVLERQYQDLGQKLPALLGTYRTWVDHIRIQQAAQPFSLHSGMAETVRTMEAAVTSYITGLFSGVNHLVDKLMLILIVPFVVFYLLKDMRSIQRGVLVMIPMKHRLEVMRALREMNVALGRYVRGQLMVCAVMGIVVYIAYFFINLPYAILFATLTALTNIIPYLGPFIGAVPAILFAMTVSWKMALYAVIINVVVQMLEGNVFSPLIVGRSLNIHPLAIILSVMVGGEVAGIAGLILAVPFVAVLKVIIHHMYPHFQKTG
ncbi:AI-2E family transporter [Aneurinibacillus sp. Ricciae_BoGa-3]|uniref:AI-2E family transporter n=1 Tax=Aneurinibacillus sp. Ricciae_BoGa-3 TaxID=3022697 RepID=UPI00234023D6|nr:AI-2E family transporter [Aneurinibacillus sp. Ricciae_BoGa-3]WCK53591.1 AI-2E family transporter [Aneurinibacillus sp. Ricciae_BoGa-3]